jgi:hypothetical protein
LGLIAETIDIVGARVNSMMPETVQRKAFQFIHINTKVLFADRTKRPTGLNDLGSHSVCSFRTKTDFVASIMCTHRSFGRNLKADCQTVYSQNMLDASVKIKPLAMPVFIFSMWNFVQGG